MGHASYRWDLNPDDNNDDEGNSFIIVIVSGFLQTIKCAITDPYRKFEGARRCYDFY